MDLVGIFKRDLSSPGGVLRIDTIRRLSPETAVSVCHGTEATWRALGTRMRMSPENYICNCGPLATPGAALYAEWNRNAARPAGAGDASRHA